MQTPTMTLQADPDIAGSFIVVTPGGEILGFGDTKAEALAGARAAVVGRREARAFGRFAASVERAIERVQYGARL
jgi:hypothetical protein